MVDINLIGDDEIGEDKTSEEKHVDDFTQTSSMDTQELAFEERTETFDTTKTAGFAHKRSYSSFASTLIIFAVIIVLGWAIYYFMFKESESTEQADLPQFIPNTETVTESNPDEAGTTPVQTSEQESRPPPTDVAQETQEPEPITGSRDIPTPSSEVRESVSPVTSQFLLNSKLALQTVTNIMTSVPSNLQTTLLSYAGQRLRFEFVSSSASEATDFTQRLNQYLGAGNFTVVSESEIPNDGQNVEKVLISGTVIESGQLFASDKIEFFSNTQLSDWIKNLSNQFGLQSRPLKIQQGTVVDGYLKIPILIRISGDKGALIDFLEEFEAQNLNVELTKILLVSPDMISYSDKNLILVLNLFLYQPS